MKKKTKKRVYLIAGITAGLLVAGTAFYCYLLYVRITALFISRGFPSPSIVYAAPSSVNTGMGMTTRQLVDTLNRLDYHAAQSPSLVQGQYFVAGPDVSLCTRGFSMPTYTIPSVQAVVRISRDSVTGVTAPDGGELGSIELEPEQLAVFFGDDFKMRIPAALPSLPDSLINAVIVTEDVRFFEHGALDMKGLFRAMIADLSSMSIREGGSTITQQLVKILFLSNRRTFSRKAKEAVMALMIAHRFTKAQILNAYLNDVYLGQNGHISIVGMGAAAKYFFSKSVKNLSIAQSALLAGMIASPNKYSPIDNPREAVKRRNYVLSRMLQYHVIAYSQYLAALGEPVSVTVSPIHVKQAPYFVDYIADQLAHNFSRELLTTNGLRIFTTLRPAVQHMADAALAQAPQQLEGALVVMQPQTGDILAMVGGRDYNESQFNRAVMSRRQIGSCVKPFIYMLAFQNKAKDGFSQVTAIDDAPLKMNTGAGEWEPQNYDKRFLGNMTVRYALQHSINIPAVKVSLQVGLDAIAQQLEQLGLGTDIPAFPSIALGSTSTSPLDLCRAYTIFANAGYEPVAPVSIKAVTDMNDDLIYTTALQFKPVGSPQACYVVDNVLLGSETEGTGRGLRQFDIQGQYAGKTGTTNDFRDAWFAGYTPDVVAVAWLGYDNEERIGLPAAAVALPVVGRFLALYTHRFGGKDFDVPDGVRFACVDRFTGLAGNRATDCVQGAFIKGTEPQHGPLKGIVDWFRHLFGN